MMLVEILDGRQPLEQIQGDVVAQIATSERRNGCLIVIEIFVSVNNSRNRLSDEWYGSACRATLSICL